MRYENSSHTMLAFDLPTTKEDQITKGRNQIFEKIWRRLLVYDQLPDNDFEAVAKEARFALEQTDPGLEVLFHNDFQDFIQSRSQLTKWKKIKKDYNFFLRSEQKRRNSENPYHNQLPTELNSWDELPNFSRQKRNQPWQFDNLYRDSQYLSDQVHQLTNDYKQKNDKDLFRAKINSLLIPDRIIFALNSSENVYDFMEAELHLANIKLSLDAFKLAYMFLTRTIESLHKIRWNYKSLETQVDSTISFAENLNDKLKNRISETEKKFMLLYEAAESDPVESEF